jgi:hypothetical protein
VALAAALPGRQSSVRLQRRLTMVNVEMALDSPQDRSTTPRDFLGTEKWGPHERVYAARVSRHDRRRLLRRLRQSSRCISIRSSRSSGFSTVTRPCRRASPDGRPSAARSLPGTAKYGSPNGVYAASVYRHDRRRLLQPLRQSSRCTSVHASRSSGSAAQPGEPKETNTADSPGADVDTAVIHTSHGRPSSD